MTAAIIWLVVWLIVGIVLTWVLAAGSFLSFAFGLAEERLAGIVFGVLCAILGVGWTILWVVNTILQIVSVVQIATGAGA